MTARIAAAAAGLGLSAWATHLLSGHLEANPLYRYGFEWFRRMGPGEPAYLLLYAALGSGAVLLLSWAMVPAMRRLRAPSPAVTSWVLAAAASVAVFAVGRLVLGGTPVTDDERVYTFQARILLLGRAALEESPLAPFLTNVFVVTRDGRWFGQYPPGHPLLLAPGVFLGWAHLVPVILAGVNLWLTVRVLRAVTDARWALLGGAMLLASPLYLFTGATLLSHSTAYLGLVLAALGLCGAPVGAGVRHGLLVGAGLGLLLVTRPYSGVTLGGVVGIAFAWTAVRRRRWTALGAALVPGILFGAFLLWYNHGVSGSAWTTGYEALRGTAQVELGFGSPAPGVDPHTPAQGLRNAAILAARFHLWAWGWPLAAAALLALALTGRGRPAAERSAVRVAAVLVAVGLASYVFYWSIGVNDTGPVKTYELLLPLGVLTVAGLRRAADRWSPAAAVSFVAASVVVAAVVFWPARVEHLRELTARIRLPYGEIDRRVEPPAVVFVRAVQPRPPWWSWVFGRPNPRPDLSDDILYLKDLGTANAAYLRAHPERTAYRLSFRGRMPEVTRLPGGEQP